MHVIKQAASVNCLDLQQRHTVSVASSSLQLAGVPELMVLATPDALEPAFSTWTMPCNKPSFLPSTWSSTWSLLPSFSTQDTSLFSISLKNGVNQFHQVPNSYLASDLTYFSHSIFLQPSFPFSKKSKQPRMF